MGFYLVQADSEGGHYLAGHGLDRTGNRALMGYLAEGRWIRTDQRTTAPAWLSDTLDERPVLQLAHRLQQLTLRVHDKGPYQATGLKSTT